MKDLISEMAVIQVLLAGVILYIIMIILRRLVKNRLREKNAWRYYDRYSPLIYAGIWAIFFYWAVFVVVENETYESLILISVLIPLIVGLAWFAGRDLLAGIIIKTQSPFAKGQFIVFGDHRGVVIDRGILRLSIRGDSGAIIRIPYNKLISEPQMTEDAHSSAYVHHFKFKLDGKGEQHRLLEQIRLYLLQSPWCVPHYKPELRLTGLNASDEVEVVVHLLGRDQALQVEQEVRRLVEQFS